MIPMNHVFPYRYHSDLRRDIGYIACDNSRRKSNCKNRGRVALANPEFIIEIREADHWYHVCNECAAKYIGKTEGESFD